MRVSPARAPPEIVAPVILVALAFPTLFCHLFSMQMLFQAGPNGGVPVPTEKRCLVTSGGTSHE